MQCFLGLPDALTQKVALYIRTDKPWALSIIYGHYLRDAPCACAFAYGAAQDRMKCFATLVKQVEAARYGPTRHMAQRTVCELSVMQLISPCRPPRKNPERVNTCCLFDMFAGRVGSGV
ncbi:uncharacterized protein [Atheta coriaria]|uniref:uncharacterized protein isoform X2 n=1 Tax=Dalotia coriaria TaxID=877792 RepID=UPI0031F44B66